ncbi:MAG: DNA topoisomerase VI subunit B [Candidatus Altiarchaeales archaeon]|nr:DNA topoisomerase VI subunit B [Candidatus Altiarchaeota archaeon]MBU4407026.1 DNA topoisomerase VI subunit B [Candidatus Altiarchaeota archaeon]MBU4437088.1 DNA topoisomerase VI subunit B [Candidatus Altiarchaeota archaeon]MCG2783026.1 DNA topoisomerase VI subunit B [Candidatus Altiarchaeales archaeon]
MDEKVEERRADDLFKEFKETSITEFFRKNKAHLGYSGSIRSLTTVIHEMVTNSLDACEEAGIQPEISIGIKKLGNNHYLVRSEDNGPGIPIKHISGVFGKMLAGTKFHRNIQLRGQQGIGVAGVTLFSQTTTGKPMKIKTSVGKGKVNEIELMIDISRNKADILSNNEYSQYWRGTEIQCELKGVNFTLREQGPFEYLRRTAIVNPHAKITFTDPEGRKTVFERSTDKVPKPPVEIKPHPKGTEVDDLVNMSKITDGRKVSSFLSSTFSRMSNAKANEIQNFINKGEAPFDLNKSPKKLTWAECEQITNAIKEIKFLAPPTEGLQPIGEDQIRNAILNILGPEFEAILTRNPTSHSGGVPFQVEVAIAYGGQAGRNIGEGRKVEVMRFANRTPLLFDSGACALTKSVNSVEWKRYGIKDFDNSAITILVNLVSTYIPYTSAGKQSVADDEAIMKEIRMALMEVGRKYQIFHSRQRRALEKEARKQILMRYSVELAAGLANLTGKDEEKILKKLNTLVLEKLKLEAEIQTLEDDEEEETENGFDDKEGENDSEGGEAENDSGDEESTEKPVEEVEENGA